MFSHYISLNIVDLWIPIDLSICMYWRVYIYYMYIWYIFLWYFICLVGYLFIYSLWCSCFLLTLCIVVSCPVSYISWKFLCQAALEYILNTYICWCYSYLLSANCSWCLVVYLSIYEFCLISFPKTLWIRIFALHRLLVEIFTVLVRNNSVHMVHSK